MATIPPDPPIDPAAGGPGGPPPVAPASGPPTGPPSGPPTGPPPGPGHEDPGDGGRSPLGIWLGVAVVAAIVAAVAITVAVTHKSGSGKRSKADEVFLEPVSSAQDPYSDPVGADVSDVSAASSTTSGPSSSSSSSTSAPAAPTAITQEVGGEPGLYGGTRDVAACDKTKLVAFLEAHPDKAAAWAGTLGIDVGEIPSFVDGLTPVILRGDTRVTNHGYRDGRATSFQAVLQAGTAVLVDRYGRPVAKCYCGNPLTAAIPSPAVYTGPRWRTFEPSNLTVVVQNTVVVKTFILVDVHTGARFSRPAGSDGRHDGPILEAGGPTPTSSSTTSSTAPNPGTTVPAELADTELSGSYQIVSKLTADSNPQCTSYTATIVVTVTTPASGREVHVGNGSSSLVGDVDRSGVFHTAGPLSNGSGHQTIDGRFADEDGVIKIIDGKSVVSSGSITCSVTYTATKQ